MAGFLKNKSSEGMEQDAPVNIASIIDCFTVLITYILAAASFISLGALDAGIAGAADPTVTVDKNPVSLHIHVLDASHLKMTSSSNQTGNSVDFSRLGEEITGFKAAHSALKAVTLSAADSLSYQDLVRVVASIRKVDVPVIFAGNPN